MTSQTDTPISVAAANRTGAVLVNEWFGIPTSGGQAIGIVGLITVLEDTTMLGFKVNSHDAKWALRIAGPTSAVIIPGCRVRQIFDLPDIDAVTNTDYWHVP